MDKVRYAEQIRLNRQKNIFTVISFIIILFIITLLLIIFVTNRPGPKNSQSSKNLSTVTPPPQNTPVLSKGLKESVQKALEGSYGNYGVFIKNLKTGENYSLRENTPYDAASLYKLWIMATAYGQIKEGKIKEDDILSQDVEVLNKKFNVASEPAELTDGKIIISVRDALEKMITISDNYSALLLTEKVRLSSVASFLKNNGFKGSKVGVKGGRPTTTPHDVALFFEKLYKNKIIDENYSNRMLSLLKKQRLNNKIPRYLPEDIIIAHKTGELDESTHDAGIVYTKKTDYIIVVLSKSDNPDLAKNRLSNISEVVYSYFDSR